MADFIVRRTSDPDQQKPVPEGARLVEDIREWWKDDRRGYVLTIDSLDHLLAIVAQFGKVVILPPDADNPHLLTLEIYDAYRE